MFYNMINYIFLYTMTGSLLVLYAQDELIGDKEVKEIITNVAIAQSQKSNFIIRRHTDLCTFKYLILKNMDE